MQNLLADRLAHVEDRIQAACRRAGRSRSEVTLVAVTKSVDIETAAALVKLGQLDLAENRPQELWRKAASLPASVRWHMIGHFQTNKIERTLPLVHTIHSVERLKLLVALDREAAKQDRHVDILLEIHTSGEANKQGFAADELPGVLDQLANFPRVRVHGLMTMAALQDPEACRPSFATLRELRDRFALKHLSMGMSNDFEVAIEEGATMVRLGTVLFSP